MRATRLRELAVRRELLVLRAAIQRESLSAEWCAATAPLERLGGAVERSRTWLGPAAAAMAGVPLLWKLKGQRTTWWRIARWALATWPVIQMARKLSRR